MSASTHQQRSGSRHFAQSGLFICLLRHGSLVGHATQSSHAAASIDVFLTMRLGYLQAVMCFHYYFTDGSKDTYSCFITSIVHERVAATLVAMTFTVAVRPVTSQQLSGYGGAIIPIELFSLLHGPYVYALLARKTLTDALPRPVDVMSWQGLPQSHYQMHQHLRLLRPAE